MDWNHLPVAGGIYDQHPQLIREWDTIFHIKAKIDQKEQEKREQKQRSQQAKARQGRR